MQIALPSSRRSAAVFAVLAALVMAVSVLAPPAQAHVPTATDPKGCHTHATVNGLANPIGPTSWHTAEAIGEVRVDCTADVASFTTTVQVLRSGGLVTSDRVTCNEPAGPEQTFQCTWPFRAYQFLVPNTDITRWTVQTVDTLVTNG